MQENAGATRCATPSTQHFQCMVRHTPECEPCRPSDPLAGGGGQGAAKTTWRIRTEEDVDNRLDAWPAVGLVPSELQKGTFS